LNNSKFKKLPLTIVPTLLQSIEKQQVYKSTTHK